MEQRTDLSRLKWTVWPMCKSEGIPARHDEVSIAFEPVRVGLRDPTNGSARLPDGGANGIQTSNNQ
jgi:hypothetical protein